MKKDFLLEIGTEEIPASYLGPAAEQLENEICKLLQDSGISYSEFRRFYTPRRLAFLIKGLAEKQEDKVIEVTGPPKEVAFSNGNLTKAGLGFAKAQGVLPEKLGIKKKGKKQARLVEVVYCEREEKGKATKEILLSALQGIIARISFPKSMRWEETQFRFARPIRWIVALFGDSVIEFELAGVKSGRETRGLRFSGASGGSHLPIQAPASYEDRLKENGVIPGWQERMEIVNKSIQKISAEKGLLPKYGVLEEVTNLVECPKAILCKFDEKYLELPKEVIIAAMETHQRYFALEEKDGRLASYFIVIANMRTGEIDKIREGNERVLRGRLEDAEFYFNEDKKIPLEKRVDELKEVIWQEGLGTIYDKTQRLIQLSKYIADEYIIPIDITVDLSLLEKSAGLCKIDLITNMIKDGKEFTKLEGLYGSILLKEQTSSPGTGLPGRIATAIREYSLLPNIKASAEGVVLAIADRIDTIVGAFILNKIPTGSKDPLGIRRAGNELIRVIIDNALHIPLTGIVSATLRVYQKQMPDVRCQIEEVFEFLIQRFRKYLESKNFRFDIINAVIQVNDDITDLQKRAVILTLRIEEVSEIATLAKRVRNILKGKVQGAGCKVELLKEPEEKELYETLMREEGKFENHLERKDYRSALSCLLNLAPVINKFFDKVLVMADEQELRENRLALLNELHSLFQKVADFSKIAE